VNTQTLPKDNFLIIIIELHFIILPPPLERYLRIFLSPRWIIKNLPLHMEDNQKFPSPHGGRGQGEGEAIKE